jgi:hypothetical protein
MAQKRSDAMQKHVRHWIERSYNSSGEALATRPFQTSRTNTNDKNRGSSGDASPYNLMEEDASPSNTVIRYSNLFLTIRN